MNLISVYLQRIGCLISVALAMIVVTALVKMTTRWLGMDSASSQKVADTAGEWAGKGLCGLAMMVGLCYWIFVFRKVRKPRMPPPLPPHTTNSDKSDQ